MSSSSITTAPSLPSMGAMSSRCSRMGCSGPSRSPRATRNTRLRVGGAGRGRGGRVQSVARGDASGDVGASAAHAAWAPSCGRGVGAVPAERASALISSADPGRPARTHAAHTRAKVHAAVGRHWRHAAASRRALLLPRFPRPASPPPRPRRPTHLYAIWPAAPVMSTVTGSFASSFCGGEGGAMRGTSADGADGWRARR
jgi:hypothetical protein